MGKKVFSFMLVALFSVLGARADGIPSELYSEVSPGTYYLYNVTQGQYLVRLSNNFPGLSVAPAEVTLAQSGVSSYTLQFDDGKYLKTGYWNNQYLWTDGVSNLPEINWTFVAIGEERNIYQLKRWDEDTLNGVTGTFYANGANADTTPTEDCQWALVTPADYSTYRKAHADISDVYFTAATSGDFYLYNLFENRFYSYSGSNGSTMTDTPEMLFTLVQQADGSYTVKNGARYMKLGYYRGQYLWTDGAENNLAYWNFEENAVGSKTYVVSSNNFLDGAAELRDASNKPYTWYLGSATVTRTAPATGMWALLTEADYLAWASSGEAPADPKEVAANKATMVSAKGNATSLLQNPSFERSADGWWGGTRTLCQLYRGSGYDYESADEEATFVQILSNMSRGTYKVVAAVRGANGTTVVANVADCAGDAVVNSGYNGSMQLNQNGVLMPWSSLGGFSDGTNALGWNFATATGTLEKDGNLTIAFQLKGAAWKGVTDVHLYYMGDGTDIYAMEYADGVDAMNHAVTCDLRTDNPNRLFTATGTIHTITNETLCNNLVSGTVSQLVLWDGADFTAAVDFIANKATFYRRIAAGTTEVVCVPFAITGGANGLFYEPKNLAGSTLNLRKVSRPEAGRAYFYHGAGDVTTLTGGGQVKATPVTVQGVTGTYRHIASVPKNSYVLKGNQLGKVGGVAALDAFRAYFLMDSDASTLNLNFDSTDDDGIWQKPQLTTSELVVGQECYLYNVKAGRFYTEGNAYGTQASVGETGLKVKFVANGDAVKLTNYSLLKKAWRTAFITTNGAVYVDGESVAECNWQVVPQGDKTFKLMMASPNANYNQTNYPGAMFGLDLFEYDLRTNLAALLFDDEEPGGGLYLTDWQVCTPDAYERYQMAVEVYKVALQLKELLDEAVEVGKDVVDEIAVYENTSSTLAELLAAIDGVTNKLLEDEIEKASMDNPLDLTDKFIANARYENNDSEGWSGTAPGINAANNLQNAEFFNKDFDCYQDLRGLPDGYYRLSVQGFYRAGLEAPALQYKQSGTEEQVMYAELYAVTDGKETKTKMLSVFTGAPTEALGVSGEIHNGSWWVPNNMSSAAAYFAAGYYQENSVLVQVTNGQLRIGLRKQTTIRRDWVMLDNWKLEYYGKNDE